jgi:hypothetical protein
MLTAAKFVRFGNPGDRGRSPNYVNRHSGSGGWILTLEHKDSILTPAGSARLRHMESRGAGASVRAKDSAAFFRTVTLLALSPIPV